MEVKAVWSQAEYLDFAISRSKLKLFVLFFVCLIPFDIERAKKMCQRKKEGRNGRKLFSTKCVTDLDQCFST